MKPKLLTTAFVAEQFAVSISTVVRWIHSGRIKAINVGTVQNPRYRIPENELSNVVISSSTCTTPSDVEQII